MSRFLIGRAKMRIFFDETYFILHFFFLTFPLGGAAGIPTFCLGSTLPRKTPLEHNRRKS